MALQDSTSHDPAPESVIECDVARTPQDVADCWRLTYEAYLRRGLIDPNPFRFHTSKEVLQAEVAIISGRAEGLLVGSATAIVDGPAGLPLDAVFSDELHALRHTGRRLLEIGLVAGIRTRALLEVLRYAIQFGRYAGCTDVLCGMHPRRERLYRQLFAMEPVGHVCDYPALRNQPVRLMHSTYDKALGPRGRARLAASLGKPVADSVFDGRFRMDQLMVRNGPLAAFAQHPLQGERDNSNSANR